MDGSCAEAYKDDNGPLDVGAQLERAYAVNSRIFEGAAYGHPGEGVRSHELGFWTSPHSYALRTFSYYCLACRRPMEDPQPLPNLMVCGLSPSMVEVVVEMANNLPNIGFLLSWENHWTIFI